MADEDLADKDDGEHGEDDARELVLEVVDVGDDEPRQNRNMGVDEELVDADRDYVEDCREKEGVARLDGRERRLVSPCGVAVDEERLLGRLEL